MTLVLAHSRGWLDYEAPVCRYWPEFAQQGKDKIKVRQLLARLAALFGFDEAADKAVFANPDQLAVVLARQKPAWEPGTRQAYHAISLGFYRIAPWCSLHIGLAASAAPRRSRSGWMVVKRGTTYRRSQLYLPLPAWRSTGVSSQAFID